MRPDTRPELLKARGAHAIAFGHAGTLAYEPWAGYHEVLTRDPTNAAPVHIGGTLPSRIGHRV